MQGIRNKMMKIVGCVATMMACRSMAQMTEAPTMDMGFAPTLFETTMPTESPTESPTIMPTEMPFTEAPTNTPEPTPIPCGERAQTIEEGTDVIFLPEISISIPQRLTEDMIDYCQLTASINITDGFPTEGLTGISVVSSKGSGLHEFEDNQTHYSFYIGSGRKSENFGWKYVFVYDDDADGNGDCQVESVSYSSLCP